MAEKEMKNGSVSDFTRFNRVLDTDRELQDGMAALARQYSSMTEQEYTEKTLELFYHAGLRLSVEELKQLLSQRLRLAADRLLPCKNQNGTKEMR